MTARRHCVACVVALSAAMAAGCGPTDPPTRDRVVLKVADAGCAAQVAPIVALVEAAWGLPVEMGEAAPLPHCGGGGTTVDATAAIAALEEALPPQAAAMVAIVPVPLREGGAGGDRMVFGLCRGDSRTGIVSLASLAAGEDQVRQRHRLARVLLHETGHALGLAHCDDTRCLMHDAPDIAALDALACTPCGLCYPRFCGIRDDDPATRLAAVAGAARALDLDARSAGE